MKHALIFAVTLTSAVAASGCDEGTELAEEASAGEAGAAGSSEPATGGSGGSVFCDPRPPVIDPTAIIDDMEDQDGSLTITSGRNGSWWTADDETPGGTIEPRQPIPEAILGGRCGSQYAMRTTGQGFNEWGAILGLSLAYGSGGTVPYDAHFRQGIRFWARVGDTSVRRIFFNVGDFHSVPEGGYCVENGTPECFTFNVTLSQIDTSWKQYVIPFEAVVHTTADGTTEVLDPSTLYTLVFYFQPGSVFDLWVDDLEFY